MQWGCFLTITPGINKQLNPKLVTVHLIITVNAVQAPGGKTPYITHLSKAATLSLQLYPVNLEIFVVKIFS